jgi:cytidylate kinase
VKNGLIITIDGPAGAGKSTISKKLAQITGYSYIDTGALYRGIALKALKEGIDVFDDDKMKKMCEKIDLFFKNDKGELKLFLDSVDVSKEIREPHMSMKASNASARPVVRKALLNLQRELGKNGKVVLEGRDMGTVVFPGADIKFYLDATVKERAKRRYNDFVAAGKKVDYNALVEEITKRDLNDSTRAYAPLKKADDAMYIDSTKYTINEVIELMIKQIQKKQKLK